MTERIGLEAFFTTEKFQAGLRAYADGVSRAVGQTEEASTKMSGLGSVVSIFLGNALNTLAFQVIPNVLRQIRSLGTEALLTAARVQEMNGVILNLGRLAGFTSKQIMAQVASVREMGIRTDVAQKLVGQFVRFNLDLEQATNLARVAQDAAVLTMQDSSDTLDRLLWGIQTYNARILRTAGLNILASKAFDTFSKETGIAVDAMTETQKQTAVLNAILKEGERIFGTYETAMEAPGKQLRSLARDIFDLNVAAGEPFLNAFGNMVGLAREVVKRFTELISVGGELFPILVRLGAIADVTTEHFGGLVRALLGIPPAQDKVAASSEEMADKLQIARERAERAAIAAREAWIAQLQETATQSLVWGANIVASLASGIARGAAIALTAAMRTVRSLLSFFLAPGSPPRIAPELPAWGARAMETYLQGFTQADFDILKGIQGPLETALGILAETGKIAERQLGKIFASLSQDISRQLAAIARGEAVDPGIFDRIRKAAGKYGDEIAELTKRQLELAQTTQRLKEIEEALENQRDLIADGSEEVDKLTRQYNEAVRAGASDATLDALLAQINAAEEQVAIAQQREGALQDEQQALEEQASEQENQVRLQDELLQQLFKIDQMLLRAAKSAAAAGGSVAEALSDLGGAAIEPLPFEELTTDVEASMEGIRGSIEESLGRIFEPLQTAWLEDIQPALQAIQEEWGAFSQTVGEFFDQYIRPVIDEIQKVIPPELLTNIGVAIGLLLALGAVFSVVGWAIGLVLGLIGALLSPIVLLIGGIALLITVWDRFGAQAITAAQQLIMIPGLLLIKFFQPILEWLSNLQTKWGTFWEDAEAKAGEMLDKIVEGITTFVADVSTKIDEVIASVIKKFTDFDFSTLGKSIIDGIVEGINKGITLVGGAISDLIDSAIRLAKSLLGSDSPSKVGIALGRSLPEGIGLGVADPTLNRALGLDVGHMVSNMLGPVLAAQAAMSTPLAAVENRQVYNVSFGDTYISDPLAAAEFDARVEQVIRRLIE